jgi:hypothetical protein
MDLLRWFRKKPVDELHGRLEDWRQQWRAVVPTADPAALALLTRRLDEIGAPEEEIEIEREMLSGLDELARLRQTLSVNGLPRVETGHRIVGTDTCHLSVPCSMPDDPAQPSGRLIFTGARAIFAGGARALTLPWHAAADVLHHERDVILVRRDRETLHRFRCNVFGDALCAELLARTLSGRARGNRS